MRKSVLNTPLPIALMLCILIPWQLAAEPPKTTQRPKIALVLEGGAALGFAHIGVIKVLEEYGIPIDIVVGTSMGAAIGGFFALGYDAARLEEIVLSIDWDNLIYEKVNSSEDRFRTRLDRASYFASIPFDRTGFTASKSLNTGRRMLYLLDQLTLAAPSPADFDSFPRRFRAVAADIANGERVVLEDGSLTDAMRASMGIPGVFAPFAIDGKMLIDGGIIDNLPVRTAIEAGADYVIAVDLIGGSIIDLLDFNGSGMGAVTRSLNIMLRAGIEEQLKDADMIFSVDLEGYQAIDFEKAGEIIALGEKTARMMIPKILALQDMLDNYPQEEKTIQPMIQPVIQKIIIEGGSEKEQEYVYQLFATVLEAANSEAGIKTAINTLERTGNYEYVRIRLSSTETVPTLVVTLHKRAKLGNSLRIGINYDATYSGTTMSRVSLSSGLVLRDVTTDNSRLVANLQILDSPSFDISFLQPLGHLFYIEAYGSARQEAKLFIQDAAISHLYQTGILELGIEAGLHPTHNIEISSGISHRWSRSDQTALIEAGEVIPSSFMVYFGFSLRRFDSPIFPMDGISVKLDYDQSLASANYSRVFRTLQTAGLYIPSFKAPLSFSLGWTLGTDFSQFGDDAYAAPPNQKPDIADRQFFPGPMAVSEQIGSHIAGFGLEAKYQLNWATRATGLPFFVLFQTSIGTVLQDFEDISSIAAFSHWNTMLGTGIRINDGFGVLVRVGSTSDFSDNLRFFVALDLGTIGTW